MPTEDELLADLMESVSDRPSRRKHGNTGMFRADLHPLQFGCTREFADMLARAAKARGVQKSTFARRALAVAIASVLGIDVRQVLYYSPKPRAWDENHGRHIHDGNRRDDGAGIESWCPHPGCNGSHL